MSQARTKRVAEAIRHEIADLLVREMKDPRLGFVSVMEVRVSPDLRYANVYVSLLGSESEKKGSLVALQRSAGWVRQLLGKKLRMRYTPLVRFFEDTTLDRVFHLDDVFKELHAAEEGDADALGASGGADESSDDPGENS